MLAVTHGKRACLKAGLAMQWLPTATPVTFVQALGS